MQAMLETFDAAIAAVVYVVGHPFVINVCGLLAHFLTKMIAAKAHQTAQRPCITDYWREYPLQSMLSLIGAVVGYVIFARVPNFDELDLQLQNSVRLSAFGIGFASDRIADAIGEAQLRKIARIAERERSDGGGP